MPYKPRIVVDFDGVLNSYVSGWIDAVTLPDPPVEGAQRFIHGLLDAGWEVVVCSTRAETDNGRGAIMYWLMDNEFPVGSKGISDICHGKPPALVYLDDRALRFSGVWPSLEDVQTAAKPWNKS